MISHRIKNWDPKVTVPKRPLIIAEAGVNHEGDLSIARRLVREAAAGGADAIKFQTYRVDTLVAKHAPAYWDTTKEATTNQTALYRKYEKFWKKEYEELKICCQKEGIEFLSSPFDESSASFLNDLMEVFKIASSEITNKPFIELICSYGKPVILSTGASNIEEIQEALSWIDRFGVPAAILHCVLSYPTADDSAQLGMIKDLKNQFPNRLVGYSDHTLPGNMKNLETATILGAEILEKHFTHDKNIPGNDHYHSMDVDDLALFQRNLDFLFRTIGDCEKRVLEVEEPARRYARRSLVAAREIIAGQPISEKDITWKRPGTGISPKDIERIINRKAKKNIEHNELIAWEMLE